MSNTMEEARKWAKPESKKSLFGSWKTAGGNSKEYMKGILNLP